MSAITLDPELSQPGKASGAPRIFADDETDGLKVPFLRGGRRAYEHCLHHHGTDNWIDGFIDLRDLPWAPDDPGLDRTGLDVGRFHHRHPQLNPEAPGEVYREKEMAIMIRDMFAELTFGREKPILMGINPAFEDNGFAELLIRYGFADGETSLWHHEPISVRAMAGGLLRLPPPYPTAKIAAPLGVDPGAFATHTARGDVELSEAIYDAILAYE